MAYKLGKMSTRVVATNDAHPIAMADVIIEIMTDEEGIEGLATGAVTISLPLLYSDDTALSRLQSNALSEAEKVITMLAMSYKASVS